jgi:hypothetical protein
MTDEDLFRSFLVNFDKGFPSDDEDDEVYKPDEPSDDDDDPLVDASHDPGPSQASIDLARIFKRFSAATHLPSNQMFLTPLPAIAQLQGSEFTVPQWDSLRTQCRLHFALLVRSIRYVSLCASSPSILQGFLAMMYSFSETFASAIEFTENLNALFERELFVPVMGDPVKSPIRLAPEILQQFQQGAGVDDIIETAAFREVLEIVPLNDQSRPMSYITHAPWSQDETRLCEVSARRLHSPELVQKFVMPGRSVVAISGAFLEEWREVPPGRPLRGKPSEIEKQDAVVDQRDPDEKFVLDETMQFALVKDLPMDLS